MRKSGLEPAVPSKRSRRPGFTFVAADGSEVVLQPEYESAEIHAVAGLLRARHAAGSPVGLLFRSERNLIINWLGCLVAGMRPLIMQYPTRKQSRAYWADSVHHTVKSVGLSGIVVDNHCGGLGLSEFSMITEQAELDCLTPANRGPIMPDDFAILQLSSGTTGYRKAMQFTRAALERHIGDYNRLLGAGETDCIVSWLPLYHDMGYVACFVMPLLLGIDVVMIDPVDWVGQPELLFKAIERHKGSICYMPNFGFEVMARVGPWSLPSMRRWISCSEPVSAATADRFLKSIDAPAETFSPCYAMAENVFAVSFRQGCSTKVIDGVDLVSCGFPIPGADVKVVDDEIWVRSPTSLAHYLDGKDIRDIEGYYPTGDLGHLIEGEVYIFGRKQDLLIQAGRKFVLSDIDLKLNEMHAEVRGRAASLSIFDDRLGTEIPTILIEALDFFSRRDAAEIAADMKEATGLDHVQVGFVPPRFITKTSSGKINRRKTKSDWLLAQQTRRDPEKESNDVLAELSDAFPHVSWDAPVSEVLDSLSTTILRIILEATPLPFDRKISLNAIVAALEKHRVRKLPKSDQGLRIVSLADRGTLRSLTRHHIDRLERAIGCPVTFEHVCLPPSCIVLSDLIFHDYFQPRLDQAAFSAVDRVLDKIKKASILLTDDAAEFSFLYESTYPALSHNLERDPRADLISFRWPSYIKNHDQLPLTVVGGLDIPLDASTPTLASLSRYLQIPIFRIANLEGFSRYTASWDYRPLGAGGADTVEPDRLMDEIALWLRALPEPVPLRAIRQGPKLLLAEPVHFCSHKLRKDAVDKILEKYESFCIAGQRASLPYIRRQLERLQKRFIQVPSHHPTILNSLTEKFDCLLICGSMGALDTDLPVVALQHIGQEWRTLNLGDWANDIGPLDEIPNSSDDWYHEFDFARRQDLADWQSARVRRRDLRRLGQPDTSLG